MEGKKKQGERVGRKRTGMDRYSINANRVITNDAEENVCWSFGASQQVRAQLQGQQHM